MWILGLPRIFPVHLLDHGGGIGEKREDVDGQIATRDYLSLTVSFDQTRGRFLAAGSTERLKELIGSGYEALPSMRRPSMDLSQRNPCQMVWSALGWSRAATL